MRFEDEPDTILNFVKRLLLTVFIFVTVAVIAIAFVELLIFLGRPDISVQTGVNLFT